MDDFSLYESVVSLARTTSTPLRALGETELTGAEGTLDEVTFETRVSSMRLRCRLAEKLVVDKRLRDAEVHAGFERLSRVNPVIRRYRRIGTIATSLAVYGEADVALDVPGMRSVALAPGPLRNEWFLVVSSKAFKALIVSEDLDGFGGGTSLGARRFRGFATHRPELVEKARLMLEERYGTPKLAERRDHRSQA